MKINVLGAMHNRFTGRRLFRQCTPSFLMGTRAGAAWGGFRAPRKEWQGSVAVPTAASGKRDWNVKNIYLSGLKAGVAGAAWAPLAAG